jgi:hypothetical protein
MERERNLPHVYIFDVDGPLSDPKARKVTEPKVIEELASMLERIDIVALNTGRSIEWLQRGPKTEKGYPEGQKGLIPLLDERISDKSLFDRFYAIGEKGGSELRYSNNGWKVTTDSEITVPRDLQQEIGRIIQEEGFRNKEGEEIKFSERMFFDDTKLTMVTSEMNPLPDGLSKEQQDEEHAKFHEAQDALVARLTPLLKERGLTEHFKIDPTAIATDIEAKVITGKPNWTKGVGKDYGALLIMDWMTKELGLDPMQLHVDTVGDSSSDIPMATELNGKVKSVRFIFVGDPEKLTNKEKLAEATIPVHITRTRDSAGTIEFLEEQKMTQN